MTVCKIPAMTVAVPTTLDDAVRLLAEQPDALLLAGGTDAMVEINDGHRRPDDLVIALNRVGDLRAWRHDAERRTVTIGAGVTYTELMQEPLAALRAGARRGVAHGRLAADPQRRNTRWQPGHLLAGRRRAARCCRRSMHRSGSSRRRGSGPPRSTT